MKGTIINQGCNMYEEITVDEFLVKLEAGGEYEIETPQGFIPVNAFYKRGIRHCYFVITETHNLTCASKHMIYSSVYGWMFAEDLIEGMVIHTDSGLELVKCIIPVSDQEVYDIWVNSEEHAYYANGITSHNSGKTTCVRKVAEDNGFGRIYQQNGTRDMASSTFLGSPTLLIDETSMQSYVSFKKGPLYLAMIHGTEVDTAGNQILYDKQNNRVYDESGQPKVIDKPALYFLDEFSVVLPEILTSVFNRALEIPDTIGLSRTIEIAEDGGRVVKSHPGFAVVFGSNLLGKGIENDEQSGYTGQNNQHDDSTLDRIDAVYEFGYNLQAEKQIMIKLLVNDKDTDLLTKFVDKIRKEWSVSTVETLFSTRQLLQLCKQIRLYRDGGLTDAVGRAFYDTVFSSLREKERQAWNQTVNILFGIDILRTYNTNHQMLIPRRTGGQSI